VLRRTDSPAKVSEVLAPNEILDFATRLRETAPRCHGAAGNEEPLSRSPTRVYSREADDYRDPQAYRQWCTRKLPDACLAQSAGGM